MRLYSIALLVAAVFLLNIGPATSFEMTNSVNPIVIRTLSYQTGASPRRSLRRYDEDEERVIGAGALSELSTKFKGGVSKLAEKWKNMGNYEAQLATKMKKVGYVDDYFTSENLNDLVIQVRQFNSKSPKKQVSVIGTLTAKFGDDGLAKALVNVEKNTESATLKGYLTALREGQLQRWSDAGNSVDDVARLLKLGNKKNNIEKLVVLDDYAKLLTPANSYDTLFNGLVKGVPDENKLGALLLSAKRDPRTKDLATNVQTSLISKWTEEAQLPANVFQWLKLYDKLDDAFAPDMFYKFVNYVDDFNKRDPANAKSALEIYRNSFKDTDVATRLVSVMDNDLARPLALALQAQHVKSWKESGKTVDDVFTLLKIETSEGAAITSRKLDALVKFIELKGGEKNLIKTLNLQLGSRRELASLLERASTINEATALQKKQFTSWAAKGISPEDVMSRIFKKGVDTATPEENTIVAKFKAFFQSQMGN
ncbi:hypothetical protein L915_04342 [Phytophthora nicotianae]|uniref:RxLR effector protein n=1 Tax=Phytophthora nicotianae TaxID=4792 RepID=W2HAF0_PHYNI|nr:hypothetical protein L915_04342 [Phytophthora nicotianae]ETL45642.1 hypothetical protein L916_04306 [Phytophthora nicotianae]